MDFMDIDRDKFSDADENFVDAHERMSDGEPSLLDDRVEGSFFDEAMGDISVGPDVYEQDWVYYVEGKPEPFNGLDDPLPEVQTKTEAKSTPSDDEDVTDLGYDLFAATFRSSGRGSANGKHGDHDHDGQEDNEDKEGSDNDNTSENDSNSNKDVEIRDSEEPEIPNAIQTAASSPKPIPDQTANLEANPETPTPTSTLFLKSLRAQGYDFLPCEHTQNCTCEVIQRLSTPPLQPTPYLPAHFPVPSKAIPRSLELQHTWHLRVKRLTPTLSVRDSFDPTRRYWIAVLLHNRNPSKISSEREFIWMKGNRFSTVKTVWHYFQTTTMVDPEDLVLLFGIGGTGQGNLTKPKMEEQMRELDLFGDRLVVFRAVGRRHRDAVAVAASDAAREAGKGKGLVDAIVPEVIELD